MKMTMRAAVLAAMAAGLMAPGMASADEALDQLKRAAASAPAQPEFAPVQASAAQTVSPPGSNSHMTVETEDKLSGMDILREYAFLTAALKGNAREVKLDKGIMLGSPRDATLGTPATNDNDADAGAERKISVYGKYEGGGTLVAGVMVCQNKDEGLVTFDAKGGVVRKQVTVFADEAENDVKPCRVVSTVKQWVVAVNMVTGEIVERQSLPTEAQRQERQQAADRQVAAKLAEGNAEWEALLKRSASPSDPSVLEAKMNGIIQNVNYALGFTNIFSCTQALLEAVGQGANLLDDDCPEASRVLRQAVQSLPTTPLLLDGTNSVVVYEPYINNLKNSVETAKAIVESRCMSRP